MSKKHSIIFIEGEVLHETAGAYLFTDGSMLKMADGTPSTSPKASWLPKSQCEWDGEQMQMPVWLALDKGLI